ncbi:MAG: spermidine synthase, partial [Bryobacteraceae bacterium]
ILLLLGATIGLPYFLLSSTSPLLQAWYVRRSGSGMPYRLFALSNFGSMLALITFPFIVEPRLTSREQAYIWSGAYVAFALVCIYAGWRSRFGKNIAAPGMAEKAGPRPPADELALWVALAACASTLLVAITNHLSQNVAPIPLLWVVPLALYLATFIVAFESDNIYRRWIFLPLLVPALGGMAYMLWANEGNLNIKFVIPGFAAGLFLCCMVCHGELARRKPAPAHLTLFYLMVSLGGAIGGIFVALIAPRVFRSFLELQIGMIACALLAAAVLWNVKMKNLGAWPVRAVTIAGCLALTGYLARSQYKDNKGYRLAERNFYGVLHVRDNKLGSGLPDRVLLYGTINHGEEVMTDQLRYAPISYYGPESGIGRAMRVLQDRGPVRAGVIGLGAGVLSTYGRAADRFRIYEINPLIENIAQTQFGYYPHSSADKRIMMGDARLTLERQESQQFDMLAVDAFSSDAIPIHLLTREALELYFRHLKPDGILALHVSNRYLDLVPVCARGAQDLGKAAMVVEDDGGAADYMSASTWVLVTAHPAWFDNDAFKDADIYPAKAPRGFRAWTDDYSNLFEILKID